MNKIVLSVIIPCYNDGKYILEAINSVWKYDGINYEIIIINDGSNNKKTLDILKDLETRGCVVINQKHKGPSSARNIGIKKSKGEYLLLLDADNKIESEYIRQGIKILDKNSKIGIVYSDFKTFGVKKVIKEIYDFDYSSLLFFNFIDTCTIIRKKVWEDIGGFNTNFDKYTAEDWIFWIDAYRAGWKFYHIPQVLFYYRIRSGSRNRVLKDRVIRNKIFNYIGKKYGEDIYSEYRKLYWRFKKKESRVKYLENSFIWRIIRCFDWFLKPLKVSRIFKKL